jgi:excisionase family DNA binding protein
MSSTTKLHSSRSSPLPIEADGSCQDEPNANSSPGETLSLGKQEHRTNKYLAKYGEPLNYPVDAAAWAIGIGRSTLWEMIKRGHVQTVKIGRRRLIPKEEVHRIRSGTSPHKSTYDQPKSLPND